MYLRTVLISTFLLFGVSTAWSLEPEPSRSADRPPPSTLADLASGKLNILDLTYSINEQNAFWPGENYQPFRLRTIATIEKNGVLSKSFSTPEHLGTHLDAPNHFAAGRPSVDQIPARDLMSAGVLIDVSAQASRDADYRLGVADVKQWEQAHGTIPDNCVVVLRTGWGRFWNQPVRYRNQDVHGKMHFPGFSVEAARYLVEKRQARGIGLDTMSIDYGLSTDFAVHHLVNGHDRYGLENLAHLEQLPPRGFFLIVAPIKLETGSGGPARVFAILP